MNRSPDLNFLISADAASRDTCGADVRKTGSHHELLTQCGSHWKLYQLQYKDFLVGADFFTVTVFGFSLFHQHDCDRGFSKSLLLL